MVSHVSAKTLLLSLYDSLLSLWESLLFFYSLSWLSGSLSWLCMSSSCYLCSLSPLCRRVSPVFCESLPCPFRSVSCLCGRLSLSGAVSPVSLEISLSLYEPFLSHVAVGVPPVSVEVTLISAEIFLISVWVYLSLQDSLLFLWESPLCLRESLMWQSFLSSCKSLLSLGVSSPPVQVPPSSCLCIVVPPLSVRLISVWQPFLTTTTQAKTKRTWLSKDHFCFHPY